ncbi:unnamed protein product [Rotaria sp. Silwood2]|nr:unnamed protein product [Rotaria sp. Silwood2]
MNENNIVYFLFREKFENGKNIIISYWEFLLSQLKIYSARSRLHDHQLLLKKKLHQLKQEQNISYDHQSTNYENEIESFEDLENKCLDVYEQAHYSPILKNINELDIEIQKRCIDEIDDAKKLKQRQPVMKSGSMQTNIKHISQDFVENFKDLAADDSTIINTIPIDGYDWNQYNRTHYDRNNPPPKTVQGYKFNIFYPNLNDKTMIPSCHLMDCEDNKDFLILKSHAGPPYEVRKFLNFYKNLFIVLLLQDIAFKIVNKEWNKSRQHRYRCQFQNDIFQLWFNFSKSKYRR